MTKELVFLTRPILFVRPVRPKSRCSDGMGISVLVCPGEVVVQGEDRGRCECDGVGEVTTATPASA